jgi:hypothetical protein
MDAVKFVEARRRMFARTGEHPKNSMFYMDTPAEEVAREVEEWATAHPHKTRQSVFLEQYPEAQTDDSGVLSVCPAVISTPNRERCRYTHKTCANCRFEFWSQEVE